MVFIAPKLSAEQALVIVGSLLLAARGNRKRFLRTMYFLIASNCFRLRDPPPRINTGNHFDPTMDDVTSRTRFNFTVRELQQLATKLQLPTPVIVTPERDAVPTVEELAMLCRRLKEPSLLFTVANEFGRSPAAYGRICQQTVDELYTKHKDLLYFNRGVVAKRIGSYCEAINVKGAPLSSCWVFVDGTR
ncbi:hypothetical protein PC128_g1936 [Phytophthora cactorum]|nr:hypothetical protein PC120_g697 [Phytophthora cactorum]KAG3104847.1 hypothetical protein PC121_g576 [Phytophthora cactorum]KAG3204330.1 hypothetical protein PC128_g1936 [Phytophthora cactorum]KAG4063809.1 hypothetical protein PC123_g1392 [Phytophthora cactorum]